MEHDPLGVASGWRTSATAFARKLLNADLTYPPYFAALSLLYLLSRLPWINLGYGTDPDAWRVVLVAEYFWRTGHYYPSRLPGYPLHELVTLPLARSGWLWTNLSTVLVSLGGVWVFGRLVDRLGLQPRGLLTAAFAFTPLLWINSMATLDYMWALTGILAAYLALISGRPLLAGIFLGVAIGFRLTSGGMLLPFGLLFWQQRRFRDGVAFLGATVTVAVLVYLPVFLLYRLHLLNFADISVRLSTVLSLMTKETLGGLGTLAVLVGATVSWRRLAGLPAALRGDPHIRVWVMVGVLYIAAFLRLPHEAGYLIPILPFGYFLMARFFRPTALFIACVAITLSGFIDLTGGGEGLTWEAVRTARLGQGLLLSNADTMRSQMREARRIFAGDYPPGAIVILGFLYPETVVLHRERLDLSYRERDMRAVSLLSDRGVATDKARDVRFVWLLTYETFLQFWREGARFYLTRDAEVSTFKLYGYRPRYFDAILIFQAGSPGGGSTAPGR